MSLKENQTHRSKPRGMSSRSVSSSVIHKCLWHIALVLTNICLAKVGFVTADELRKAGQDPSTASKWPAKYGDGYVAYAAGLHHMHCLVRTAFANSVSLSRVIDSNPIGKNFIRKATFRNGEYDDARGFRLVRPDDKDASFRMAREEDLRRHIGMLVH